jgi:hypothetical protein
MHTSNLNPRENKLDFQMLEEGVLNNVKLVEKKMKI